MAKFLRIIEWSKYQHYKDRNPAWIKLHAEMLTSFSWTTLDDSSRLLAIVCMLLAARTDNKIPLDRDFIQRSAYLRKRPDVRPLVECGFAEVIENNESVSDASIPYQTPTNVRPEEEEYKAEKDTRDSNRKHSLPEDFIPKPSHYELAKKHGVIVDVEFPSFRDHFLGNGGLKLDWDRAFNNWIRRTKLFRGNHDGRIDANRPETVKQPSAVVARFHNNRAERERAFGATVGGQTGANGNRQEAGLGTGNPLLLEGQVTKLP